MPYSDIHMCTVPHQHHTQTLEHLFTNENTEMYTHIDLTGKTHTNYKTFQEVYDFQALLPTHCIIQSWM